MSPEARNTWIRRLRLIVTIIVGGFFVYAGSVKWMRHSGGQPSTIFDTLLASEGLRVSACLVEIAIGLWLISQVKSKWSGRLALLVLLFFCGVVGAELLKDRPKPCGCTGKPLDLYRKAADVRFDLSVDLSRNALFAIAVAAASLSPTSHEPH